MLLVASLLLVVKPFGRSKNSSFGFIPNLRARASNLLAMASNLLVMAPMLSWFLVALDLYTLDPAILECSFLSARLGYEARRVFDLQGATCVIVERRVKLV